MQQFQVNDIVNVFNGSDPMKTGTVILYSNNIYSVLFNRSLYMINDYNVFKNDKFKIGDSVRIVGVGNLYNSGIIMGRRTELHIEEFEICGENQYHIWASKSNMIKIRPKNDAIDLKEITTEERIPYAWIVTTTTIETITKTEETLHKIKPEDISENQTIVAVYK